MVKYKYKGVQYDVPTMPEDIDFGQYLDLKASHKELTFVDVLSILVGVDASNIESQEFQSLLIAQTKWVADLINDCNEPEHYSSIEWEGKQVSIPKSFGEMNLGQRLMLEQEFNSHHDNADIKELYIKACCIFLAPCIYGPNWSDELELMQGIIIHHEARKLMRLCNFFEQAEAFNKLWNSSVIFPEDVDGKKAGVEKLNRFGLMLVVDNLASGDLLKYNTVLDLDNNMVLMKMQLESEKAMYQDRLRKVKS